MDEDPNISELDLREELEELMDEDPNISEIDLRDELEQLMDDPNISELDLREEFEQLMDEDPNISEIDLREEFEQLLDEDPNISEIDLREEFEDWFPDYNPSKFRHGHRQRTTSTTTTTTTTTSSSSTTSTTTTTTTSTTVTPPPSTCYEVVIAGLSGTCDGDCVNLNGTYLVELDLEVFSAWVYDTGTHYVLLQPVGSLPGPHYWWFVQIYSYGLTLCANWQSAEGGSSDPPPASGYSWVSGSCNEGTVGVSLASCP
jgi:hypothetical protein